MDKSDLKKKLTVTNDENVSLNIESAYAKMAKDRKRDKEALEWSELTFKDVD
jgi:hypothetical protein